MHINAEKPVESSLSNRLFCVSVYDECPSLSATLAVRCEDMTHYFLVIQLVNDFLHFILVDVFNVDVQQCVIYST